MPVAVDDGFLGGIDCGRKQWIDSIVRQHREGWRAGRVGRTCVRGRKRKKEIARRIACPAAKPAEAHSNSPGDPLELMWKQRRVGCHDHDDGTATVIVSRGEIGLGTSGLRTGRNLTRPRPREWLRQDGAGPQIADFWQDGDAENSQVTTIVTLNQDADRIATLLR